MDNPYRNLQGGRWMRGNLHTHTIRSDGKRPPQEVIDDYAGRGYGFLMLSDHDVFSSPQDYASLDPKGLILICGNEVSANGPHLLHVDADRRVEPSMPRQTVLDQIRQSKGFAIVNHPMWGSDFEHCSLAQMVEWTGYAGMEIYNGVISRLDGSPYALDRWDQMLSRGRRVWGFANDDSHANQGDVELGWNVAYVTDYTAAGVVKALKAGRFYASTGVTITQIMVNEVSRTIRLETQDAHRIVAVHQRGQRIATVDQSWIELVVPEKSRYVRFECWGAGERFAWTQPFWME